MLWMDLRAVWCRIVTMMRTFPKNPVTHDSHPNVITVTRTPSLTGCPTNMLLSLASSSVPEGELSEKLTFMFKHNLPTYYWLPDGFPRHLDKKICVLYSQKDEAFEGEAKTFFAGSFSPYHSDISLSTPDTFCVQVSTIIDLKSVFNGFALTLYCLCSFVPLIIFAHGFENETKKPTFFNIVMKRTSKIFHTHARTRCRQHALMLTPTYKHITDTHTRTLSVVIL